MNVSTKALRDELAWVKKFTETKASIPILTNALFEVDGGRLTLTTTDLEVAGITSVECSAGEQWNVTAPIAKLIQYLAKVDEPEVTLTTAENWLSVKHGAHGTRIAGMSKDSYPELPKATPTMAVLRRLPLAVERTAFAISSEESRFTLNGALLEIENDQARLVTTDGHRLSLAPLVAKSTEPSIRALIPKFALVEAGKLGDGCEFSMDKDHLFLNWGQRRIVARKLSGNFPDYHRVMPAEMANHVFVPVKTMLRTVDRVATFADERSHAVRLQVNGNVKVFASSVEQGEAEGSFPYKAGEITGAPFDIGLNAKYVSDFLSRTDQGNIALCWQADEPDTVEDGVVVRKGIKGNTKAIVLATADGWRIAIMPMRI